MSSCDNQALAQLQLSVYKQHEKNSAHSNFRHLCGGLHHPSPCLCWLQERNRRALELLLQKDKAIQVLQDQLAAATAAQDRADAAAAAATARADALQVRDLATHCITLIVVMPAPMLP